MPDPVLVVDLDFSLLATDVTYESIIHALGHKPQTLFRMPFWLAKGKVAFKNALVQVSKLNTDSLPLNQEVVEYVRSEHERGRYCILATASLRCLAQPIADRLGMFDAVIATETGANLGGQNKVEAIRHLIGDREFDYIGDRSADIPIWKSASSALAVNPKRGLAKSLGRPFDRVFITQGDVFRQVIRSMRVHQWLKNLLLFLPLVLAHEVFQVDKLLDCVLAFLAFSFCASSVYILNDIVDLEADRFHPRKRKRPLASGALPVHKGVMFVPILFGLSTVLALSLSIKFFVALLLYVCLTSAYSFYLKRVAIVDVLMLAGLYAYRVLCGAIAVSVGISAWMLAFSMFIFLSLAFVKRYSELLVLQSSDENAVKGRGYRVGDASLLLSVGTASGYMAVLVMALYISSGDVVKLYSHPNRLWMIEPLLLYWITRVWYIAHRSEMHDDPVVFAMEDRTSYLVALLSIAVIAFATMSLEISLW